ncbi:chlorite dismutase family protein [Candidatus Acetothermia bacterium]|nr:chlorite dismutase family protein [Candidatus Acetothermia bacterium]MBI3643177.1 chlorite dismutase family protein [Candidatus Acetothermia bacterium]
MAVKQEKEYGKFLRYTLFKTSPEWRRLSLDLRRKGRSEFAAALEGSSAKIQTFSYNTIGIKADGDLLLWQMSESLEALQESTAKLLQTGLGHYMDVSQSLLGIVRPSHYVKKQTAQEQAISQPDRLKYLIAYPFVKTIDWYLMKREARQGMMNEHIRVGHEFSSVRQVLAYSFGVDDQEFVVTYETDQLEDFQDLVMALRDTEGRRYTLRDTPILVGIYRPLQQTLELLG